ncbi:MAG: ribosome biogenesis GTPase Der [Patescibacteria group bacterium]|jgi:GTP-binding protein
MPEKKLPTVVLVGRINVGKSSFFNCLTETGRALISPIPGTTRDYNLGQVAWRKKNFNLIDTGGVNIDNLKNSIQSLLSAKTPKKLQKIDAIETEIIQQTKEALNKADLIIMVTDGKSGLLPADKELALVLKKLKKPVILVSNKVDNQKWLLQLNDFFKLGLGKPWPVSAVNGSGVGDFLDELIKKIKWPAGRPAKKEITKSIRVAIVGKPNVGKSSLVNQILGEKRVIVSPIPQTTREPQDTEISYKGKKILLIDTAGLRKKARIEPGIEKLATRRSLGIIHSADIVLFLTEVDRSLTKQDNFLAGLIKESRAGIIVIGNKWDLLTDKDEKIDTQIKRHYQSNFSYLSYAPLIFISALTGRNVDKILDLILTIWQERIKEVPPEKLSEVLKTIVKKQYPAQASGQNRPKLYSLVQTKTNPPEFTVYIGPKQNIHFSYLRFVENQIRENFGFTGIPVKIKVKQADKYAIR